VSIEDDVAFLERVPTFAVLGRAALRILAIGADTRHVAAGEVLYRAGDKADSGFVIQHGELNLRSGEHDSAHQSVVARPGALLGEYALFADTTRTVTAIALTPVTLMRIPRSLFLKMLEGFPDAANQLRAHLATRVDRTATAIAGMRDAFGPDQDAS
jgi:CRP-like cAMP-binding protein